MAKVAINKTQAKELLDFCTNNMLTFFERRAEFVLSNNTLAVRDFLAKLPYYLHFNQPKQPFYVPDAPAGIQGFSPDREFMRKHRFNSNGLVAEEALLIKAIYLMGSITSVTFASDSDLDIWVVVERDLSQEQRSLLAEKLAQINVFFTDYDLSFYIVDEDHILYDRQSNQIITDLGVRDKYFLLDEFYRSVAYLAGKPLLWFALPEIPGYSYQEVKELYLEYKLIEANEWVDFGGFDEKLSRRSFYATILWLLYKGLNNPFKSYLKILLLEYYISLYPQVEFLAQTLKRAIHANGMEQVDLRTHLDLYTLFDPDASVELNSELNDQQVATTESDSLVAAMRTNLTGSELTDSALAGEQLEQVNLAPSALHEQANLFTELEPESEQVYRTAAQQLEAVEQQLKQELANQLASQKLSHKEQFVIRSNEIFNRFSWENNQNLDAEFFADNESSRLRASLYEDSLGSFTLNQEGQELIEQGLAYLLKVSQQQQTNFEQFVSKDALYAQLLQTPALIAYLTTSYFDSYELVLAAVMLYLEQQQDHKRKGLVASSLLLKLNSRLAPTLAQLTKACEGNSWKAVDSFLQYFKQGCLPQLSSSLIALLSNLGTSFGVSLASQKAALHFNYWKIGELVNYSQLYQASLIKTYISLTEFVFADLASNDQLQISFLSNSELEAIEESIFSLFIRHRNQVTVYKLLPDLDLSEEALYFGSFLDEEGKLVWYVITFDITDPLSKVEHKHVEVKYDLISLVTWCYLNGLITDKTKLFIKPAAGFDRHYLEQVVQGLKLQFGKTDSYFKRLSQKLSDYLGDTSLLATARESKSPKTKLIQFSSRSSYPDLADNQAPTIPSPGVGLVRSFVTPISETLWPEYLRPSPSFLIEQGKVIPPSWFINSVETDLAQFAQNMSHFDRTTNSPYLSGIAQHQANPRLRLQAELAAMITRIAIVCQQQGLAPALTQKLIAGRGQDSSLSLDKLLEQYAIDLEQTKAGYLLTPFENIGQDQEALGEWLGYFSNAAVQRQLLELDTLVLFQRWDSKLLRWQFTTKARQQYQSALAQAVPLTWQLEARRDLALPLYAQPSLEAGTKLALAQPIPAKPRRTFRLLRTPALDGVARLTRANLLGVPGISQLGIFPASNLEAGQRRFAYDFASQLPSPMAYLSDEQGISEEQVLLPENLLLVYRRTADKEKDSLVVPYTKSLNHYLQPPLAAWERDDYVLSFVINCNQQGWLQIERKAIPHKDDLALLLTAFSQYGEVSLVTRFYRQLERFLYSRALVFNYRLLPEELEQFRQAMKLIPRPNALSIDGIFTALATSLKADSRLDPNGQAEYEQLGVPRSSLLDEDFVSSGEIGADLHKQVFPENLDASNLKSLNLDLQQLRQQRQARSLLDTLKARFGKSSQQQLTMQQLTATAPFRSKLKANQPAALLHSRKYINRLYLNRYSLADLQALYELGQLSLHLAIDSLSDSVAKLQQLTTRLTKLVSLSFTRDLNQLAQQIASYTEQELAGLVEPSVPYAKISLCPQSDSSVAKLNSLNSRLRDLRKQKYQGKQLAYPLLESLQQLDVGQLYRELNLNLPQVVQENFSLAQLTQINLDPVLALLVDNLPNLQTGKFGKQSFPSSPISVKNLGHDEYVRSSRSTASLEADSAFITQGLLPSLWQGSWRYTPNYAVIFAADSENMHRLPLVTNYSSAFITVISEPSRAAMYFAIWLSLSQPQYVLFDLIRSSLRMQRIFLKARQLLLQLQHGLEETPNDSKTIGTELSLNPFVRYIYGLRHKLAYQISRVEGYHAPARHSLTALRLREYVAELCFSQLTEQEFSKQDQDLLATNLQQLAGQAYQAVTVNYVSLAEQDKSDSGLEQAEFTSGDFFSSLEQVSQEEVASPPTSPNRARFNRYGYYSSRWMNTDSGSLLHKSDRKGLPLETQIAEPLVVDVTTLVSASKQQDLGATEDKSSEFMEASSIFEASKEIQEILRKVGPETEGNLAQTGQTETSNPNQQEQDSLAVADSEGREPLADRKPQWTLSRTQVANLISDYSQQQLTDLLQIRQAKKLLSENSINCVLSKLHEKFTLAFQGKSEEVDAPEVQEVEPYLTANEQIEPFACLDEQASVINLAEPELSAFGNANAEFNNSTEQAMEAETDSDQAWSEARQFFDGLKQELLVFADLLDRELAESTREKDVYRLFSHNWHSHSVAELQAVNLRFNPLLKAKEYSLGEAFSDTLSQVVNSLNEKEQEADFTSTFVALEQQAAISREQAKLNLGLNSFNPDLSSLTYNLLWLLRHDGLLRVLIANEQLQLSQLEVVKLAQLQSQLSLYKQRLQQAYQDKLTLAQQRAYYLPNSSSLAEQALSLAQKLPRLKRPSEPTNLEIPSEQGEESVDCKAVKIAPELSPAEPEQEISLARASSEQVTKESAQPSEAEHTAQVTLAQTQVADLASQRAKASSAGKLSFTLRNSKYQQVMADLFSNRVLILNASSKARTTEEGSTSLLANQTSFSDFKKFSLNQLRRERVIFNFAASWYGHWNLDLVSRLLNTSVHARDSELSLNSATAEYQPTEHDFILTKTSSHGFLDQLEISVDNRAKLERYLILNRGKEFELMRPLVIDSNTDLLISGKSDQRSSLGKELQQLSQRRDRLGQLDVQIYLSDSLARQAILRYEQQAVPTPELLRNYQRNLTKEFKVAVGCQLSNYLRLIKDSIKLANYRQQVLGQTQDTNLLLSDLLSLSYLRDSEELTSGLVFIYYNRQLNAEQVRALLWLQENSQLDILNFKDQLIEHCYLVYTTKVGTWRNVKFVGKQALNNLLSYIQFHADDKHSFSNLKIKSLNFKGADAINEAILSWLEASLSQQHILAKKAESYEQAYFNYRKEYLVSNKVAKFYVGKLVYEQCLELKGETLLSNASKSQATKLSQAKPSGTELAAKSARADLTKANSRSPLGCLSETARSSQLREQGLARLCWQEVKNLLGKLLPSREQPKPIRSPQIRQVFRLTALETDLVANNTNVSHFDKASLKLPSLNLLATWQLEDLVAQMYQKYNRQGVFQIWVEDIGGFAQEKYNFIIFTEGGEVYVVLESANSLAKQLASSLIACQVDLNNRLRKTRVQMLSMYNLSLSDNQSSASSKQKHSISLLYNLPLSRFEAEQSYQLELVFTPMRNWSRRLSRRD